MTILRIENHLAYCHRSVSTAFAQFFLQCYTDLLGMSLQKLRRIVETPSSGSSSLQLYFVGMFDSGEEGFTVLRKWGALKPQDTEIFRKTAGH